MLRLRNELNTNSELISPRTITTHNNSVSFVPFLNERDSLGRLIGITPKRYNLKSELPRSGGNKTQLLSKIYQDSQPQQSTSRTVTKSDELESPSGMDFWRSEEILPRIKRNDFSIGELKINKKSIKSRNHGKNETNSARDLPERVRIPPIGFYDVSSSIQYTKQKQRTAIIFEEHKKRPTELQVIKEAKENNSDKPQGPNSAKINPTNTGIKSERHMRLIDNRSKPLVAHKDSAASFVEKRSYFKRLKSREDEDMYVKYQQSMNNKFNEMREKLNMLKGSINQE